MLFRSFGDSGVLKSSAAKSEGISGLQRCKSEATNAGELEDRGFIFNHASLTTAGKSNCMSFSHIDS